MSIWNNIKFGIIKLNRNKFWRIKTQLLLHVVILIMKKANAQKRTSRRSSLPMGFAEQVLQLQIKLQEEQSLQLIQILNQMYRIGLDYYLDNDIKKADYFQKKMNNLLVKSLTACSVEKISPTKQTLSKKIKQQVHKFKECGTTYVQTFMEKSAKDQKKVKDCLQADLDKQEEQFQVRMLKRCRSNGKF